jgi:hypothetical protein
MITLKAAYGRKYKTEESALLDWIGGKDFQIINGPYCSIRDIDLMKSQFDQMQIRYGIFGSFRYVNIWASPMTKILATTYI